MGNRVACKGRSPGLERDIVGGSGGFGESRPSESKWCGSPKQCGGSGSRNTVEESDRVGVVVCIC